jgi:hypothetical protein
MTTASPLKGSATALTITLASLAASATAGQESTAVNAGSGGDDCFDAEVWGQIMTGTTPANASQIEIWLYGGGNSGELSGGAAGSNGGLTPSNKTLMKLAQIIQVTNTSNVAHEFHLGSVAAYFGNLMPEYWGVWVLNNTNVALNSTGSNHWIKYRSIKAESA